MKTPETTESETDSPALAVGCSDLLAKIGNCRACGMEPVGEEFRGRKGDHVTHGQSQNGWWLVVTHQRDIYSEIPKFKNRVDNLLCPVCKAKHDKDISDLFDEHFIS